MTPDFDAIVQRLIDGQLSAAEWQPWEAKITSDPALRKRFMQLVSFHALLATHTHEPSVVAPTVAPRKVPRWAIAMTALAASVLSGFLLFNVFSNPATVAQIIETKSCRWDSGTLPTASGSRLTAGRLNLSEGLARIVFSSGAEITIEGPTEIELKTAMACVLHRGQLSAKVPPTAHGFVVETPTSVLTDLGTEFGVKVDAESGSDVQVFSGQVDVLHRQSGQTSSMITGHGIRFESNQFLPLNSHELQNRSEPLRGDEKAKTTIFHLSTAMGKGQDAFVMAMETIPDDRVSDTLLLIKKNKPAMKRWDRMAYLGFDLTVAPKQKFLDAELTVTFAPTGMGYASLVPDATFTVYGIRGKAEEWSETDIDWATAPANIPGEQLDFSRLVKLGSFVVPQGLQSGPQTIHGADLANFVNDQRRFGSATLIITRETIGRDGMDLVHGIASRRHPTLRPPTLRLTLPEPK